MKRTFAKRSLQTLVAMFFLMGGLLFVSNSASAQTISTSLNVSGYSWVAEDEALAILQTRISLIHNQLNGFVIGTPSWNEAMRRSLFYKGIYREINDGSSVPDAIVVTHTRFANANIANQDSDNSVTFTPAQAYTIADEAINLLRI
jgi:hypothetical protein